MIGFVIGALLGGVVLGLLFVAGLKAAVARGLNW